MITISDWLKRELDSKQELNQTALAIHLGISQGAISSWLRGLYVPQPENCRKLARFFDIPEEEVLIIAGHRQPHTIGTGNPVAEPRNPYHIGPRARLDVLLDRFTDDQIQKLLFFLETFQ